MGKWVVGTGRCGLHNYAHLNGGMIQSESPWKRQGVKRYHGDEWDRKYVEGVIKDRIRLNPPCFADCAQFMFIDIIRELDKNAEFVWLVRKKDDCVKSFLQRVGEADRIHPKGWKFETERKKELIEWYYDEVNKIICEKLQGAKYEVVDTYSMNKVIEK